MVIIVDNYIHKIVGNKTDFFCKSVVNDSERGLFFVCLCPPGYFKVFGYICLLKSPDVWHFAHVSSLFSNVNRDFPLPNKCLYKITNNFQSNFSWSKLRRWQCVCVCVAVLFDNKNAGTLISLHCFVSY